jgi:(R)-2-hydroxyacyl-CoA dehydratese activating ATPase
MLTAGLDIGSRTIAVVEWDGWNVVREEVIFTGADPLSNARSLIEGRHYDNVISTGYGRHLAAEKTLAREVITEIKAFALGAHYLFPDAGTVLDIGGQDSKVIQVNPEGGVVKFEMNDRCAAGTGRFLENMALALNLSVDKLGEHALSAQGQTVHLSNMCAVFAESEVVSLIGRGADSRQVALGIHQAISSRITAMIQRIGLRPPLVFAGGVANNPCMRLTLAEELKVTPLIPSNPQTTGALGAAIYAAKIKK